MGADALPPSDAKKALRRVMVERRAALAPHERARLSQLAAQRLAELPEMARARCVAGFMATRTEVDPSAALLAARARGADLVLPRVWDGVPRLRFHRAKGPDDLRPGAFGVLEPDPTCPEISIDGIDLFVVPGLAFDSTGRRLGYGGGFFDEIGAQIRALGRARLIGFAFEFQVIDVCPVEPGDVPVDVIVTDARVLRPGAL